MDQVGFVPPGRTRTTRQDPNYQVRWLLDIAVAHSRDGVYLYQTGGESNAKLETDRTSR